MRHDSSPSNHFCYIPLSWRVVPRVGRITAVWVWSTLTDLWKYFTWPTNNAAVYRSQRCLTFPFFFATPWRCWLMVSCNCYNRLQSIFYTAAVYLTVCLPLPCLYRVLFLRLYRNLCRPPQIAFWSELTNTVSKELMGLGMVTAQWFITLADGTP